ncbi:MAG: aminotransferase class IV [Cyclobacteriaceae bacterium]|nr:aminotransferase class IV [Cyclobacteriaceae bacterium]
MYRFIETIKLLDGQFFHLAYHQRRMDQTIKKFFDQKNAIHLKDQLASQSFLKEGLFKCRIVYDKTISSVEFFSYTIKPVRSLKVVHANAIEYAYKFEARDQLLELYDQRGQHDEIIIVKNNLITDASYANLIFFDGVNWITPNSYLLDGTMRQILIDQQKIKPAQITLSDITNFEKVKLINSMLGFEGPEVPVSQIEM